MATEILSIDALLNSEVEPTRQFRWVIAIEGIDAYTALSSALPGGTFTEISIPFINTIRYLSGKWAPKEWKLTLWNPIAPSAAQKVMDWIRTNYEQQTGRMGYSDFYKKDISIKLLDGPGGVASSWTLKGAWVKDVDFGTLDYSKDDLIEIGMSIRFDTFVLNH
jgi:hypothetical protein